MKLLLLTTEEVARIVNDANRAYCIAIGDPVPELWDNLDEETKQSAMDGISFALKGASPEESHNNWMKFKTEHGWTYGEEKDLEKKTHPCLVPYDELPYAQKVKDKLFLSIIDTFSIDVDDLDSLHQLPRIKDLPDEHQI